MVGGMPAAKRMFQIYSPLRLQGLNNHTQNRHSPDTRKKQRENNNNERKGYANIFHHALVLNSSWVMSRIKKPFWNRLFFGGSRRTLLLFCLPVSSPVVCTDSPFGFILSCCCCCLFSSPETAPNDSARDKGGETRLGAVPIAFEIESKGRMGRETGNEGMRRGKVAEVGEGEFGDVGDVGDVQEVICPTFPLLYIALDD